MNKKIITITLNPAFDLHCEMEHFEAEKENYSQEIHYYAGGKGINTSRALTVTNVDNTAYIILAEENGDSFERQLNQQHISHKTIWVPGRIRENITLHPIGQKETRISFDTFSITKNHLDEMASLLVLEPLSDCLIAFSGRVPKGIDKKDAKAFIITLIQKGAKVIVDSNSFTPEDLQEIHPWFIKPNEQEIGAFLGYTVKTSEEAMIAAKELARRGVAEEVMISLGGDGAVFSNGLESYQIVVPKLDHPVSTIGAGDSTLAGYLAGRMQGLCKKDALKLAVAYGTSACMTPGTEPPRKEDIDAVLKQVSLY